MRGTATTCFLCEAEIVGSGSRFCADCRAAAAMSHPIDDGQAQAQTNLVVPAARKKRLVAIVAGVAACLVASAGVGALLGDESAEERIQQYLTGAGEKEFFAADLQFRASFPAVPKRSTKDFEVAGMSVTTTFYMSEVGDQAFAVNAFDIPEGAPFDLNLGVNGGAVALEGRVESAGITTVQGYEAVEFVISGPQGMQMQGLLVRAPRRVYQLTVAGASGVPEGYEKFERSFEITQP